MIALGEVMLDHHYTLLCFMALQSGLMMWIFYDLADRGNRWYYAGRPWFSLAIVTALSFSVCFVIVWCAATVVLLYRTFH